MPQPAHDRRDAEQHDALGHGANRQCDVALVPVGPRHAVEVVHEAGEVHADHGADGERRHAEQRERQVSRLRSVDGGERALIFWVLVYRLQI